MDLDSFDIFTLPTELILHVISKCPHEQLIDIQVTCKTLNKLVEENRNSLASKNLYHVDLEKRRVRAWREIWWCDRIPFKSFEYISTFFCNVNIKALTVNRLDEEICDFLLERAHKKNLRFEQLRLFHSCSASHKSICNLMKAANCTAINFEAVESKMTLADLKLDGYQKMAVMSFEMDDSIEREFFTTILDVSKAKKFIFHACDKIPPGFIRDMLQKWVAGARELHAVRITTNQDFSFDDITRDIEMTKMDNSTWKIKNKNGEEATITMRRNAFHFFIAFEVNGHRVENILYRIPSLE